MTRKNHHLLPAALAVSALLAACAPGAPSPRTHAAAGFAARLDSIIPELLRESGAPGLAVGVVEDGRVAFTRGYGVADRASGRAMTPRTVQNVASVSKPVAAWGVMRLVERGELPLDTPVDSLLRDWRLPPSEWGNDGVTVRRLLSHTAGTSMPSAPLFPADTALPTLRQVLRGEVREGVQVVHRPGSRWAYSGGGYVILETLVEEATRQPFAEHMRRTIFAPLGMEHTTFAPAAITGDGIATPHDEQGAPIPPYRLVGSAAGGLYSNVDDMALFLTAYAGHGRGIIGRQTFDTMLTDVADVQMEGGAGAGARWGLGHGVHRTAAGERLVYHSGGNPGYLAYLLVMPERGDGIVLMMNGAAGVPALTRVLRMWSEHAGVDLPPIF